MATPDRGKALDTALAQIERQFGKGSVMRLGDEARVPIEVIPTGSIALDVALGIGGLPRGRVVEIYGPESSGKTTVALHAVANAQRARPDQHVGDLQRLLAGVGLGNQQAVGVDAETLGVVGVERMLGVDERGDPAGALRVGDRVQGDGGLAGGLRSVDLHHPSAG